MTGNESLANFVLTMADLMATTQNCSREEALGFTLRDCMLVANIMDMGASAQVPETMAEKPAPDKSYLARASDALVEEFNNPPVAEYEEYVEE